MDSTSCSCHEQEWEVGHAITSRVVTKISSCQVVTTSRQGIKRLGISFGSIFLLFSNKSSLGPLSLNNNHLKRFWCSKNILQYFTPLLIYNVVDVQRTDCVYARLGYCLWSVITLRYIWRCLALLIEAGADVNAREEFSTAFKTAQKKHMRSFDGLLFLYSKSKNQSDR